MATVDDQVAALETLSPGALRDRWLQLKGAPLPQISPDLMRLALAWEIQARAYGGLSRTTRQKLTQLGAGNSRTTKPPPGTRLVREWQGRVHVVTIGDDKIIRWNDRSWNSLSEVARAITGTQWSGPAFFGLKRKHAA